MLKIFVCAASEKTALLTTELVNNIIKEAMYDAYIEDVTLRASKLLRWEDDVDENIGGSAVLLFFLEYDYSFEGFTGIEWARKIRKKHRNCYICFMYNKLYNYQELLKGDIHPSAALLNPIKKFELSEVLGNIYNDYLIKHLATKNISEMKDIVSFNIGADIYKINKFNILYFESCNKKIYVHTVNQRLYYYDSLQSLGNRFKDTFIRCHNSFLVNKNQIEAFLFSEMLILLKNGDKIPITRTYKKALKTMIENL